MRENRTYGSEGGEAKSLPYPYRSELMASDSWSSKRLAEEFRALQPISPRQLDCFGNADPQPRDDVWFFRARMQRDWRGVQRQAVVLVGNPKRFGQLARPRAQQSLIVQSTATAHCGNAMGRLQGADQHRTRRAFLLADEIDAPMDAIGAIDIGNAWRPEHHQIARRRPAERMRGRFGVMIGLDLDDDAADAVNQQSRPDQVGRDLVHAAGKERTLERPAQLGCGSIRRDGVLS